MDNSIERYNRTTPDISPPITSQLFWIQSLVLSSLTILIHIWIAFNFLRYARRHVKNQKNVTREESQVFKAAVMVVVLPFIRSSTTQSIIYVSLDETNNFGCEVARDIGIIAFVVSMTPVYAFLWLRQRAFYANPVLSHIVAAWIKVLSRIVLVVGILLSLGIMVFGVWTTDYKSGPEGCVMINETDPYAFRGYLYGGALLLLQSVTLFLLLYPLCGHFKARQKRSKIDSNAGQDGTSASKQRCRTPSNPGLKPEYGASSRPPSSITIARHGTVDIGSTVSIESTTQGQIKSKQAMNKKLYVTIKRTTVLACVCMVTDIITMFTASVIYPASWPQIVLYPIYDVNILINVTAIIGSYANWREILFPCC